MMNKGSYDGRPGVANSSAIGRSYQVVRQEKPKRLDPVQEVENRGTRQGGNNSAAENFQYSFQDTAAAVFGVIILTMEDGSGFISFAPTGSIAGRPARY
jgi:hypothetical protein